MLPFDCFAFFPYESNLRDCCVFPFIPRVVFTNKSAKMKHVSTPPMVSLQMPSRTILSHGDPLTCIIDSFVLVDCCVCPSCVRPAWLPFLAHSPWFYAQKQGRIGICRCATKWEPYECRTSNNRIVASKIYNISDIWRWNIDSPRLLVSRGTSSFWEITSVC